MSGKHIKVRALRSGVGTLVVTVGVGLVAWVVIGLALVLPSQPQPPRLDGSTQGGASPSASSDSSPSASSDSSSPAPSAQDGSRWQERSPAETEASSSARPRTDAEEADGSGATMSTAVPSDAVAQPGSVDPSSAPDPSTGPEISVAHEEPTLPPWAYAPGKAKGHDKRPPRDLDKK